MYRLKVASRKTAKDLGFVCNPVLPYSNFFILDDALFYLHRLNREHHDLYYYLVPVNF